MKSLSSSASALSLLLGFGLTTIFYLVPTASAWACENGRQQCQGGWLQICRCDFNGRNCYWSPLVIRCYRPSSEPPSEFQHMTKWKGRPVVRQLAAGTSRSKGRARLRTKPQGTTLRLPMLRANSGLISDAIPLCSFQAMQGAQ